MNTSTQSSHTQPSLTVERDTEFIVAPSTALYEYVEPALLKATCLSKQLQESWDEKSFAHSSTKKMTKYLNEREQLRDYRKLQNKKTGLVKVSYYKSKSCFGRAFVSKCLGFTNMRKTLRNALIKENYIDIDLENAQIRIACALCEMYGHKDIENLKNYVSNRTEVLAEIMAKYDCDKKKAKDLMITLSFGGSFKQWALKNKIENTDEWSFLKAFGKELTGVAYFLKSHNPSLYESCRQQKENKTTNKDVREGEVMRSFIATYLQHWECKIISTCLQYLHNETDCLDFFGVKVATYEYDGFKIMRKGYERFKGDLLRTLEKVVLERIGLPVVFAVKEMDEFLEIEPITENENTPSDSSIIEFSGMISKLLSDTEYSHYINKNYPKQFIWCEDEKTWVCWNDVKWEKSPICLYRHISYYIPNKLEEQFKPFEEVFDRIVARKIADEEEDDMTEAEVAYQNAKKFLYGAKAFRVLVGDTVKIKSIAECCKTWLRNEGIVFDAKDYLTGFNNGVYDLFTNTFRPYRYDDFVSMTTGFDFSPINRMLVGSYDEDGNYTEEWNCSEGALYISEEEEKAFDNLLGNKRKEIVGELQRIFPDEKVRTLVLVILSKIFYGKPMEYCAVFNGSGGNGKGVLDEFIQYIFGDYCCVADYGLITQEKSRPDAPNSALMAVNRKRLIFMSEPEKSSKISNGAFKSLTGGGTMSARDLHTKQNEVILSGILILECNERLKFKDIPQPKGAEHRRLMDILFPSRFTMEKDDWNESKHIYPMKAELKTTEWRDAHRNVMYNILIKYALELRDAQFSFQDFVPQCVKDRVEDYLSSCNDLHTIFDEIYEKVDMKDKQPSPDNLISIADIAKRVKAHSLFKDLPKDTRTEFSKASYLKQFFTSDSKYKMKYDSKVLRFDIQEYDSYTQKMKTTTLKFSKYLIGYKLIDQSGEANESDGEDQ